MYQTKYILPFHDRENKHRQGVNDGSFQKHFRQPRNHRIRKATLGISDILDILIVAYIIYKIIFWIKETRAWVLFKGILVIFALAAVAMLLKLNTILWILSNTISVGIIAVIVVFQPELRKALEQPGQRKILHRLRQKL